MKRTNTTRRADARAQHRDRERRGLRRASRAQKKNAELSALFDDGALPSRLRGYGRARAWLHAQSRAVIDAAHELLRDALDVCPSIVTAPTYKQEIGASALVRMAPFAARSVRGANTFAPPPNATDRDVLIAYLRHVFELYPTPAWLMATVLQPPSSMAVHARRDADPARTWIHVAQGGSFVDAGLPVVVTRAVARVLADSTVAGPRLAVRAAQLEAARVPRPLRSITAAALAQLPFGAPPEEALLDRLVAFLAREPVPVPRISDVVRFIAMKARTDVDFSFAGRTAASFIALLDREMPRFATPPHLLGPLPSSGIPGGTVDAPAHGSWLVKELDSGLALQDEGVRMHHCVATYAARVATRASAIFSAVPLDEDGSTIHGITVEVSLPRRAVVQVKGYANRPPTPAEIALVRHWAETAALAVAIA